MHHGCVLSSSHTNLDSRASVVAVGKNVAIVNDTSRRSDVSPFTSDYESFSKVPIVDAPIRHACFFSGETYLLIARNILSVTTMDHDLTPLFVS